MPMMFDSSASYQGPELEMRGPVSSTHCSRAISGSNETSSWKPSKFSKNPCKCQKIHWIDRSGALILNSCLWLSRRVVFRVAKPHPKVMWLQRSQASIWRRSHGMYLDPAASRSSEGRFRYCRGLLSIAGIDMSTWHFLLAKRCRKCSQVHPLKQKGSLFVLLSFLTWPSIMVSAAEFKHADLGSIWIHTFSVGQKLSLQQFCSSALRPCSSSRVLHHHGSTK